MIAEKTITAQRLIEAISPTANKVNFVNDTELTASIKFLEDNGIPTNKHEDYKYCNVDALLRKEFKEILQDFRTVTNAEIKPYKLDEAINLVVVNGNYNEALSDKIIVKGITIKSLNDFANKKDSPIASLAQSGTDAFIALSNSFSDNGVYILIDKGNCIPMPIQVIYVNASNAESVVNSRSFIHLQSNAELTLTERFINLGSSKVFSNFLSEKLVEENAKLVSYTIQEEGKMNYSVHTNQVKINRYATYDNTTITLSGQLVRNNHNVVLSQENCQAHLNGLFYAEDAQLVDNHTLMDHQVANCESNELYKGVINGKSTGVFNGKIFVRKDAQKTNAYQSSKNI